MGIRGHLSSSLFSFFLLLSQKYIVLYKWTSYLGLLSPIIHFSSRCFPYLVHHVASKNDQHIWGNDVGRRNTATQVAGYSVLLVKETLSQCTSPAAKQLKLGTKFSHSQVGDHSFETSAISLQPLFSHKNKPIKIKIFTLFLCSQSLLFVS